MKKTLFTLLTILCTAGFLSAQDVSMSKASISKTERPVIQASYTMPSSIVSDALSEKLKESNIKGSGDKVKGGFRVYKGVSIDEISDEKLDVYTKVSGKKNNSTLYMAVSRGYDNFVSTETDPELAQKTMAYIKSMMKNVNVALLKQDIVNQAKVVNSVTKTQKSEDKSGSKLRSQQKSLENDLKSNKAAQEKNDKLQEKANSKVKEEEAKLSELKSKLEMMVK